MMSTISCWFIQVKFPVFAIEDTLGKAAKLRRHRTGEIIWFASKWLGMVHLAHLGPESRSSISCLRGITSILFEKAEMLYLCYPIEANSFVTSRMTKWSVGLQLALCLICTVLSCVCNQCPAINMWQSSVLRPSVVRIIHSTPEGAVFFVNRRHPNLNHIKALPSGND